MAKSLRDFRRSWEERYLELAWVGCWPFKNAVFVGRLLLVEISSSHKWHGIKWLEKMERQKMNIYLSIQSLFASQDLCKTNVNNPWYNSLGNMAVDVDLLGDSLLRSLLKMKSSMILPPKLGVLISSKKDDHVTRGFSPDFELGTPKNSSGKWRFGLGFPNPKNVSEFWWWRASILGGGSIPIDHRLSWRPHHWTVKNFSFLTGQFLGPGIRCSECGDVERSH